MRKKFLIFIGCLVHLLTLAVVLFAAGFWWAAYDFNRPGPLAAATSITIARGSSLMSIAHSLESAHAIDHGFVFVIGTRLYGAQAALKAGEYALSPGDSPRSIMEKIRKGDTIIRRVIVPEGLTSSDIVDLLKKNADLSGDIAAIPPEGSLLPGSYDYALRQDRQNILDAMKSSASDTLQKLWPARVADLPFTTPEEALTLASIVEKETGKAEERKRVAGVFINRLRQGIPLQSDPTVIYGITKGVPEKGGMGPLGRRLLTKDLQTDTPYNTYLHAGLPPGPVCNPGKDSLAAVLNPETHDFLYFVADGTGGHVFAQTLQEHEENVKTWRKIRKAQNP